MSDDADDPAEFEWAREATLQAVRDDIARGREPRRRYDPNHCSRCGTNKCCDPDRRRYEDMQRDYPESPDMYFGVPSGCSGPMFIAPDWQEQELRWQERRDEWLRFRAGLMFFAALAAVGEEIKEWSVMAETGWAQ